MTQPSPKVAAKVRTDLLNLSRKRREDYQAVLQRYALERLLYRLGTARITVQADVGFGDVVTPGAEAVDYPVLLDHPSPKLRAYSKETVIAEKLQAMVHLGEANSRMKDFYDLWVMARAFDFSGALLCEAISATFERRGTELPDDLPIALSPEFFEDDRRNSMWQAFFQRSDLNEVEPPFSDVGDVLRMFLAPVLNGVSQGEEFRASWSRAGSWDFDEGGR